VIVDVYAALQAVLNGLLTGALYALVGMGLALIFGVMRIVNFAHGAFLMLGMSVTTCSSPARGSSVRAIQVTDRTIRV
jgi:branched-subunit amino acid ABC-type transport system permease component